MTQVLLANQVATGLALTLFGLGLSALIGQAYSGLSGGEFPHLDMPGLSDLPLVGRLLFSLDYLVYLSSRSPSRSRGSSTTPAQV